MALRFIDSFDHYVTADIGKKWTAAGGLTISAGNGRNSTSSMRSVGTDQASITLDSQATWIIGFGWRATATQSGDILALFDSGTTHIRVIINSASKITINRSSTLLATSTTSFSANTWYHLGFEFTIHDTAGVVKMWVNGVAETLTFVTGTETTQDTRNAGNASANIFAFKTTANTHDYDDLYLLDGTDGTAAQGAANNAFLGDCRVEAIRPSGTGNSAQFTPSAGSNFENVDDTTADGDSTYNASSTSGHIDSFAMANLAMSSGSVYGVQTNLWARKDDAGSVSIQPHFRINSTNYARTSVSLGDTYLDYHVIEGKDPDTGSVWTLSGVNGCEYGYKMP